MNNGLLRADERFNSALNQIFTRLHEHLEPHVVRRAFFLDEPAVERELGIRCGRETNFDFLEAAFHKRLEQLKFLADVHRHGERLIAVAQIHTAPDGRVGKDAVRPLPVGQADRRERTIFFRRLFVHVVPNL
jgi:hypothetical protein